MQVVNKDMQFHNIERYRSSSVDLPSFAIPSNEPVDREEKKAAKQVRHHRAEQLEDHPDARSNGDHHHEHPDDWVLRELLQRCLSKNP